jgi:molecular chaperone DnaK
LGVGVAEDSRSIDANFKSVAKKYGILSPVSEDQLNAILGERIEDFHRDLRALLRVAPIIHRNSALPSKRSEFFNTLYENQAAVQVIVVQGEGESVGENRMIGTFMFPLKQPCPAGSQCEIQLTYDQNGMVHVLAKQLKTSNQAEAVFDSRTGEVTGWVTVSDANPENDDDGSESLPHGVRKNAKGSNDRLNVSPSSEASAADGVRQQNATLVKARRHLMRMSSGSPLHQQLLSLIAGYEELLAKSAAGEDCDEQMEAVEAEIEKFFS